MPIWQATAINTSNVRITSHNCRDMPNMSPLYILILVLYIQPQKPFFL